LTSTHRRASTHDTVLPRGLSPLPLAIGKRITLRGMNVGDRVAFAPKYVTAAAG
jgi:hypothetical protein